MSLSIRILLAAAVFLFLAHNTTKAHVAHGVSDIFALDTVVAVNDDTSGPPQLATITALYPNPFNPRTTITFTLAEPGEATLAVFDLRGRCVCLIDRRELPAGRHEMIWGGLGDHGQAMPSGTYFCRLETSTGFQTVKMTLAR